MKTKKTVNEIKPPTEPIDKWIWRIHETSKIIIGILFAAVIMYLGYQLERNNTTKGYLVLLSSKESPVYLKGLVFSSMLDNKLIEPDILFTAAYRAESELGQQSILKDLFYEYSSYLEPFDIPIGNVDLVASSVGKDYVTIPGWALDSEGDICRECIFVAIDGIPHPEMIKVAVGVDREDIENIFTNYEHKDESGFSITIPRILLAQKTQKIWVRIRSLNNKYMDILDTNVSIRNGKLVQDI